MENIDILQKWFATRNEESFEQIYSFYKPSVYRYILNLAPRLEEAVVVDIVQDVFVELYAKAHSLRNINKFKPWLYSIAKFVLYRYYRKEKQQDKKKEKQSQIIQNHFSLDSPVEKTLEKKYFQEFILEFQSSLKPLHREMFVLRFFEEEKYKDIAKICKCSLRKVKYDIKYIFQTLQKKMEEKGLFL